MQHAFCLFFCHCFVQLQRCFVGLNRQTSKLHIIFMEELSYVLTQYFVSCVHVRFYFSLPLIFTLLAAPSWPLAFLIVSPPVWIFMFFFLQNSSLLFSITRSSSFSVIHVSVNIKNNVEKDTTLLLFFLSKSPGGHVISFQIKPWVAFGLPYLLIELFYIGMPVVRTDSRAVGRSVYGHVITTYSYPWCSAALTSPARARLNGQTHNAKDSYAPMICPFR